MAEIKGGITVSGGSVDSMPVILDGRKSIYEEAIEKGIIDTNTTYEQFLESLSVKPNEIKKAVKDLVDENLEKKVNQAVAVAVAMLDLSKIPIQPAPTQPATGGTGNNAAATPAPAPTQPATGGTGNNAAATPAPAPTQPATGGTGNNAAATPTPAPTQPATGGTGNNAAATPTPAPTQPATGGTGNNAAATDNSGVSDEALADILKDLGS